MNTVKEFFKEEKLIHPSLADKLDDLTEEELDKLKKIDSLVLKISHLKRIRLPEIKVNKLDYVDDVIHVSDFTELYLERYHKLKEIILDKLDENEVSSIDKLSSGKASVVGMVRKIKEKEVIIEDNTGKISLKTDDDFIKDEVVGVKGKVIINKDETIMYPDKIIYPDVPLKKQINKTEEDIKGMFVSKVTEKVIDIVDAKNIDYLFSIEKTDQLSKLEIPCVVLDDKYTNDVNIKYVKDMTRLMVEPIKIVMHDGKEINKIMRDKGYDQVEVMLKLLKRRHLNPQKLGKHKDKFFLDDIPDIIHVKGEDTMVNYKGVTMVSTGKNKCYIINFKTRDIKEIEID